MAYDRKFFDDQRDGSLASAREVVPLLVDLVHPRSVADVGCGVGTWLKAFRDAGVEDVIGADGAYARDGGLLIPEANFRAVDLAKSLDLGRRFDLALSLEVGEHLPAAAAPVLVDSLTRLAPVVAFSAAVPYQGGTDHMNEQWPDYWAALFKERGYVTVDAIRPRIWNNERIESWYRQNLLLFAHRDALAALPALAEAHRRTSQDMLSLVHPTMFASRNQYPLGPLRMMIPWVMRRAASAIKRAILGKPRRS